MSELEQKFEKISKYHNDIGFLSFLQSEAEKGADDYDIELATQALFVVNGHVEDTIQGENRTLAFNSLIYAMELYESEKQAKKDAVQKMMAEEDAAASIDETLKAMKEKMPSLDELSEDAKAKIAKMNNSLNDAKKKLEEKAKEGLASAKKAASAASAAASSTFSAAKDKFSSMSTGMFSKQGGKRRSKKNKSKKNKSKKSKK